MSSLFASLTNAGSALDVLQRAMGVVQNNVANASTPGYVTQTLTMSAGLFDPSAGLWGGVDAGNLQSSRNSFDEQNVWTANEQVGMAAQQSSSLQSLQSAFDVTGSSGIPLALSTLYSAFSAWSNSPSDSTSQQQVITAAQGLSQAFNTTATSIDAVRSQAVQQTQNTVQQINTLTSQIAAMNAQIRHGSKGDAGLDAQLYNNIEQLSNLVNITARPENDGTMTVLLGGQIPLVIGQTQTQLQVTQSSTGTTNPGGPADQKIVTSDGQDASNKIQAGQLGGLLGFTNVTVPSILGNGQQQGSLNELAQGMADRVNALLMGGQTSAGTAGTALFAYSSGFPTAVAGTLAVNPAITAAKLAPVSTGPPSVGNGVASELAQLTHPSSAADMLSGMSYTDFYSSIASHVGTLASGASTAQKAQTQVLTQAQNMRAQTSGVSLNDQAALLLEFQQSYQASAQAISTVSNTIKTFLQDMQQVA